MAIRSELFDFLTHLRAVDSIAERKALVLSTGQSDLGIYLNWQGSVVEFFTDLLAELSRRGKAALVGFLAGLANAGQIGVDLEDELARLRTQVEALDTAGFAAEFPAPAAITPAARPPSDPDMLAAAVSEVVAPYYALGADGLRKKAGERAATMASQAAQAVEAAFAGDASAMAILGILKTSPAAMQPAVVTILKARLAQDATLAGQLAGLLATAAAEPEGRGLQRLVSVNQEIGVVRGDVVGAVVGADVLNGIRAKVEQHIEVVEPGATVVGFMGGTNAPVNIGGTQVNTGGGDYTGGSKTTTGNISGAGIAIGSSAQASMQQGLSGAELAAIFQAVSAQIDRRPDDPNVDRDKLRDTAQRVKDEVAKGQAANPAKVERWLNQLLDAAPDVAEVALAALANPVAGVATAISKLAQRLRASRA